MNIENPSERLVQQVKDMLCMQDITNSRVHPTWRDQEFAWHRAAWIECAELMDHYGWKWWKFQESDMAQVRLELVDIWHFGLSMLLMKSTEPVEIADAFNPERSAFFHTPGNSFLTAVELLAGTLISYREFPAHFFAHILEVVGMSTDELYELYIQKNVLNMFRQDHGYKKGTYQKIWDGREDNEVLVTLSNELDSAAPNYPERLYAALVYQYATLRT